MTKVEEYRARASKCELRATQVHDLGRPSRSNWQSTLVLFFILNDKLTD
jgi:hypothetical protein